MCFFFVPPFVLPRNKFSSHSRRVNFHPLLFANEFFFLTSREAELLTRVTSRFSRPAVTRRIASTTTPRRSFKLSRSRKRDYRKVKDLVRYLPMYTRANTSITSAIQTQILKLRLRNSFYRRVAVLLLVLLLLLLLLLLALVVMRPESLRSATKPLIDKANGERVLRVA